ncbi:MAG: D-alanyl-D-alanine carboxypeptidase [Candidatus Odyssella sp.]|nr:D-alanyl-D-alanine carboxypeptidase [Candidatus Odyssella sp.]
MLRSLIFLTALALAAAPAAGETTRAKQAILVEHPSGRVLFERAADQEMAPSSMTKLMTLYLAFEALKAGRVSEATTLKIGKRAAAARGATMGLAAGDSVAFRDLVRGAAIASANDAAIAIAEHLGTSEAAFAKTMTAAARELGLAGSRFANATGQTAKNHRMTAGDVAKLAGILLQRHPERYRVFGELAFRYGGRNYANRNRLLGSYVGADGIKTGMTAAGGYGMAASAVRDGKRLILVINGLASEEERAAEARRLLDWGFARLSR